MLVNHGPSQPGCKDEYEPWKWGVTAIYSHYKDHVTNEEVCLKIQQAIEPHRDLRRPSFAFTYPLTAGVVGAPQSHGDSRAKYNLTEPISLQVEHVAVEFVVDPFRPSCFSLRTTKTSAQWCCVDTSHFTHNWETGGGWERLISSRTGPKDLLAVHRRDTQIEVVSTCLPFTRPGQNHPARHNERGKMTRQTEGRRQHLKNGQAWSSPNLRGQWRTEKKGGNWLWNHLWCPSTLAVKGLIDNDGDEILVVKPTECLLVYFFWYWIFFRWIYMLETLI